MHPHSLLYFIQNRPEQYKAAVDLLQVMSGVYNLISNTLEADQIDLLDLNSVKNNVETHFKFLFLKKRFNEIRKSAPVAIDYDHDGFHVKNSTFETLDEVEKAILNKAFL